MGGGPCSSRMVPFPGFPVLTQIAATASVLIFWGGHNKEPQTGALSKHFKVMETYCPTVLAARSMDQGVASPAASAGSREGAVRPPSPDGSRCPGLWRYPRVSASTSPFAQENTSPAGLGSHYFMTSLTLLPL